jgi:mono/diheme cytochrome c family protein
MAMKRETLGLAVLLAVPACWLLAPAGRAERSGDSTDLATRARDVLRKHCAACHSGTTPRAGLRVLDHDALLRGRKVIVAGAPDGSELIDYVEGGSMPPGIRPKVPPAERALLRDWVQAGAPPFPTDSGEPYVWRTILADVSALAPEKRANARYVSLNHLSAEEAASQRAVLARVLAYLTPPGKRPAPLAKVDSAGTVLRFDLEEQGWQRRPYKGSTLTLFDLALLEYPYGTLPLDSPLWPRLAAFLASARQVRPVPYVRGDWLADALVRPPLHSDFLAVLGKPADSRPPSTAGRFRDALGLPAVVAELGSGRSRAEVEKVLAEPAFARLGTLARKGKLPREVWESNFARLARRLGAGVPIVPFDALGRPDCTAEAELTVELRAIDYRRRTARDPEARITFAVNDELGIWIRANQDAVIELIYSDDKGEKSLLIDGGMRQLQAGRARVFGRGDKEDEGFPLSEPTPGDHFILYAYPKDALEGLTFPGGKLLKGKGVADRVVHPLYELRPGGKGVRPPDPGKMVKKTVTFRVRK